MAQPDQQQQPLCGGFLATFLPASGKELQPRTTSLYRLSPPTLKITKYHLHLHLFQAQSKRLQSCSLNFWFLLLVLVVLMVDYIFFIELRIILVMDHGGVQVSVRVLS